MFKQPLISFIRKIVRSLLGPIEKRINELEGWIKNIDSQPGDVQLSIISETNMSQKDVLGFKLDLSGVWPEDPNDISSASIKVSTKVTDESGTQSDLVTQLGVVKGQQELTHEDFRGDEDSEACIEICLVDNKNNKGTPKSQKFTLLDTIAPGAAGDIGVVVNRETTVDTPDTPVAPTTPVEPVAPTAPTAPNESFGPSGS